MNFIKRYLEKLVVLCALLVFILAMVFVLVVSSETREVTDTKLRIPKFRADYVPQDPSDNKFIPANELQRTRTDWAAATARNGAVNLNHYSDLLIFPGVARCPHPQCGRLIPVYYFSGKKCPECGGDLPAPERAARRLRQITEDDTDGDGITDELEKKFGLDVQNPGDALYDLDGDGFSNIYEVENNTNPTAPMSRPPLWYRLRFDAVRKVKIPVEFRSLITNDSDDKTMWDIQINDEQKRPDGRPYGTRLTTLGGTIKIGGTRYKIADVDRKISGDVDSSTMKLVEITDRENPETIILEVGKPTYNADQSAVLNDVSDPEFEVVVRKGEVFAIGNREIGVEEYRLKDFDMEKGEAVLLNPRATSKENPALDKNGRAMIVTRHSEIPEDSRVQARPGSDAAKGESAGQKR